MSHPQSAPTNPGTRHGGHPGGHPGGQARTDVSPLVSSATPRSATVLSVANSWIGAAASALLFVQLGIALDAISRTTAEPRLDAWFYTTMAALAIVAAGSTAFGAWFAQRMVSHTEATLRARILRASFEQGAVRTIRSAGTVLSMLTDAAERTANYRAGFIGPTIGAFTVPLVVLAVLAIATDLITSAWLILLLFVIPAVIAGFRALVRPIGGAYRSGQARLTASFLDAIRTLDTLVYARAAQRTATRLAADGQRHRRGLMRMLAVNQMLILVVDAVFSLAVVVAATLLVGIRIDNGALTLGQGATLLLSTVLVTAPVDLVGQFFYIGITGRAAQAQVSQHLDGTPHQPGGRPVPSQKALASERQPVSNGSADKPSTQNTSAIDVQSLTAGWPAAPPIIRNLTMRVETGERVAITGPSGVGKSTLSAVLQGHLAPRSGTVRFGETTLGESSVARVRSMMSVVEQRTFLFRESIAANLRLAAPDASDEQLWNALERAQLAREVRALPGGLATNVGEGGTLLSGGQAQRLSIARAWLRDAQILILDEPTSQVDLAGESRILEALHELAVGRTVLMIAHRPGAILAADRVVELHAPGGGA